jgi:predicted DNA-binding protein
MPEDRGPQLSVPIDAELKARLEAAAAREDRPVASFVRRIVMKALDGVPAVLSDTDAAPGTTTGAAGG